MKLNLSVALLLVLVACVPPPAAANHETGQCTMESSAPGPAKLFFSAPTAWLYVDTNGFPGIQRSDIYEQDQLCGHPSDLGVPITWCVGPTCIF